MALTNRQGSVGVLGVRGLVGLIVVVAVLYFTGAGAWVWERVRHLDEACYSAMSSGAAAPSAGAICGKLSVALDGVDRALTSASNHARSLYDQLRGGLGGSNKLDGYVATFQDKLSALASSQERLSQMVRSGPSVNSRTDVAGQFQQAVDSFSISQTYLKDPTTMPQALSWLRTGASQPQGFGVMSQLTLGSLYAKGGQGVEKDPRMAEYYLTQAKESIARLSTNGSPQSQQLIKALPEKPEIMLFQLDQEIQALRMKPL